MRIVRFDLFLFYNEFVGCKGYNFAREEIMNLSECIISNDFSELDIEVNSGNVGIRIVNASAGHEPDHVAWMWFKLQDDTQRAALEKLAGYLNEILNGSKL